MTRIIILIKLLAISLLAISTAYAPMFPLPKRPPAKPPSLPVSFAWDAPESGVPIAGYRIYYGPESRSYTNSEDVGFTTNCTSQIPPGTFYAAVTAYGIDDLESDFSNEVSDTLVLPPLKTNRVVCVWSAFPRTTFDLSLWPNTKNLIFCETNPVPQCRFWQGYGLTITVTNF